MFKTERALTDQEIEHLNYVAGCIMSLGNGLDAAAIYNIRVGQRSSRSILEDIVKADSKADTMLFEEITIGWPQYVRDYLGSQGWQYGYGYIGEVI